MSSAALLALGALSALPLSLPLRLISATLLSATLLTSGSAGSTRTAHENHGHPAAFHATLPRRAARKSAARSRNSSCAAKPACRSHRRHHRGIHSAEHHLKSATSRPAADRSADRQGIRGGRFSQRTRIHWRSIVRRNSAGHSRGINLLKSACAHALPDGIGNGLSVSRGLRSSRRRLPKPLPGRRLSLRRFLRRLDLCIL